MLHQALIRTRSTLITALLCLSLPATVLAAPVVSIGTGPQAPDGSYLNATIQAQLLVFTNSVINADDEIIYTETVNIRDSLAGVAVFNISHNAPKLTINGNITVGTGDFIVNAATIDLGGAFIRPTFVQTEVQQFIGNAATVNVLSNNASLQQAIYLTQNSASQSVINAGFGSAAAGLVFDFDTLLILSGGLLSGNVALNHAGAGLQLRGYGFEIDTGSGYAAIGQGSVAALSGSLKGTLDSGDLFEISFTQGLSGQITIVPVPAAIWMMLSGLIALRGTAFLRRR